MVNTTGQTKDHRAVTQSPSLINRFLFVQNMTGFSPQFHYSSTEMNDYRNQSFYDTHGHVLNKTNKKKIGFFFLNHLVPGFPSKCLMMVFTSKAMFLVVASVCFLPLFNLTTFYRSEEEG